MSFLVGGHNGNSPSLDEHLNMSKGFIFEEVDPDNNGLLDEEEEEDPSEIEEDEPEELNFAEDLEAFLNEPEDENMATNGSGNSIHSTHQSMLSSSSMANQLGSLAMNPKEMSKTSLSKGKSNDVDEDMATSNLMGAKKPRGTLAMRKPAKYGSILMHSLRDAKHN
ncbi:hypothetical protein V2J09_017734 [Rumex salicifolius]